MRDHSGATRGKGKQVKSIVLCNSPVGKGFAFDSVDTVKIGGNPICVGRIEVPEPAFDAELPENRHTVLVKVRAFSCNFRDKPLILLCSKVLRPGSYCPVGSEFVGEVLAVGAEVRRLREGDRVIADGQYPYSGVEGLQPALPTNGVSRGYLRLHEAKLMKVPAAMRDEIAAAFGIGAQTTYAMLRRLDVTEGSNVLVTSARSNTSLFAINALKNVRAKVYATSTSEWTEGELARVGVEQLIQIDPALEKLTHDKRMKRIISETGGFDYVIDPFFDLHISKVVEAMSYGAKYVACGLYDQHSQLYGERFSYGGKALSEIMVHAIAKNLQFLGNCLGETGDLQRAIEDYNTGNLNVHLDSVFHGEHTGDFFARTYNAKDRLGKVVYRYPVFGESSR